MGKGIKLVLAAIVCAGGAAFLLLSFDSFLFFGLPMIAGVAVAFWNSARRADWRTVDQVTDVLRIYFGGHLLWSCIRYWSTDMQPVIHHPLGGPFVASLVAIGAFPFIKTLEGVVGIALLGNRFVPLALVLEVPTSMTIFYLNTFVTARPSGLATGPTELGVNVVLLLLYFGYYRPFLVASARAAPPLNGTGGFQGAQGAPGAAL
ncbi:hypothetical protein ACFQ1E_13525 [Sphingomonas canadensis]|uniref:Uncharacterized protein n=1 Tax=Sphingomonas canadensis TaxID=1219257 RepID=A0ABW3HDF3_9SPHN|nr:hypothetical protein [Sphingomonas canadensis]MCW3836981.1 hypothetical protein [Sphingomonas canadensis]